jgi:hypothetical protein
MGKFFTNVQLHANTRSPEQMRTLIIQAIRERMNSFSLIETDDEENCDRTILIGPVTSYPWIAIYDQVIEGQDISQLEALTSALSSQVKCTAVGILIHDSDVLELRLFRDGTKVDEFCSWPGYFEGRDKPQSRSLQVESPGHPELWRSVLINGATEADLQAAWENSTTLEDACEILKRIASVVGWNQELVSIGIQTMPSSILTQCTLLRFKAETYSGQRFTSSELPIFCHEGGTEPNLSTCVGEQLEIIAIAHNTGGASQGMSLVVWGSAIAQELVNLSHAVITSGAPETGQVIETSFETILSESGLLQVATLPELILSKGVANPAEAFSAAFGDYDRGMKIWLSTRIHTVLFTSVVCAGTGEIHVGFVPTANPDEGQTSWSIQLDISSN